MMKKVTTSFIFRLLVVVALATIRFMAVYAPQLVMVMPCRSLILRFNILVSSSVYL